MVGKISHHFLMQDPTVLGHHPNISHTRIAELKGLVGSLLSLRRFRYATAVTIRIFDY